MSECTVKLLNNPYVQSSFDSFRQYESAFVDKTLYIKYLDEKNMSPYPILLRPRGFGRSSFVHTLKCFYDISYKNRYEELFSGTKIYEENLSTHNSYYVIDFDFSKVNTENNETLEESFYSAVKLGIDNFKNRYKDFVFDYSKKNITDASILFMDFSMAFGHYSRNRKLYVMVDGYDSFANEIFSKDLPLNGNFGFIRAFFASLKVQTVYDIAKIFITGTSSISLEGFSSGFNIALNVTSLYCFNEYSGFTEEDLNILIPKLVNLEKLGVSTKEIIERMKNVYGGYCFCERADKTVYNSSMCLYYLDRVREKGVFLNPEEYFDPASDQNGSKLGQLFNLTQKETAEFIIDTYLQGEVFYLGKLSENINLNQLKEYSREQLLSMLYYLGYLTIDREKSSPSELALKIPNRFMSKLFAKCTIDFRFKDNTEFDAQKLDLSALTACDDDISAFAQSCTEFFSRIMNNQVLYHMNEMALNLALFAKLDSVPVVNTYVKMQQSLQVPKQGEKFADLVITVNKGLPTECIYLIELKYLTKKEAADKSSESTLNKLIKKASEELTDYKSAIDFKGKNVKAYAMIFAGPDCVYCELQR